MTRHNRHNGKKNKSIHKRKNLIQPPFFINKNQQFEMVRKEMKMKTDGPTLDEISNIDTTIDLSNDAQSEATTIQRPISPKNKFRNWFDDYTHQIVVTVIASIILFIFGKLVYDHSIHLVKHDKDIQYLQKKDDKQDVKIEQLEKQEIEINTDIRLIKQRIELSADKQDTK